MGCSKIEIGETYNYRVGDRMFEKWKCVKIYFNEKQDQWLGRFEVLTDPYHCNRIGKIESLNEIEMERYISKT
jgi:hypothetical protein